MRKERALRPVELGRAIGLSAQQARRYERLGYLPPAERTASGHRRYGPRHLHAILAVRAMQAGYGWLTGGRIMRRVQRGNVAGALELVDECHAALHQRREEVAETLEALRLMAASGEGETRVRARARRRAREDTSSRVGEAARLVGVRVSSLHYWEEQGLLRPRRDEESGYRLYDAAELRRLRIVVVLRKAGYRFDAIRAVLDELAAGRPSTALTAIERRQEELAAASERCSRATAALWGYVVEVFGKPAPLSGSLKL